MVQFYLVDDEDAIREGMQYYFPWGNFGAGVTGSASNGETALQEILSQKPDVVLTDIVMPRMNGVELSKRLRESGYIGEIIFISAHQEMSYAKAALKLAAADFLFKPIEIAELEAVVAEVVRRVEQKKERQTLLATAHQMEKQERLLSEKRQWKHFFMGGCGERGKLPALSNEAYTAFAILLLQSGQLTAEKMSEILFASTEFLRIKEFVLCHIEENYGLVYLVLGCARETAAFDSIQSFQYVLYPYDASAFVYWGGFTATAENLVELHQRALQTLGAHLLQHTSMKEYFAQPDQQSQPQGSSRCAIVDSLLGGTQELLRQRLQYFFWEAFFTNPANFSAMQSNCSVLCFSVYTKLETCVPDQILVEFTDRCVELTSAGDMGELYGILECALLALYEKLHMDVGNIRIVQKINGFVQEQLAEITVSQLAEKVHLSKNYLTVLYKKHTGITLNDYITGERMKKAASLLQQGDQYIYEIANAVGYRDTPYFSRLFRQQYGCLPAEYKEREVNG